MDPTGTIAAFGNRLALIVIERKKAASEDAALIYRYRAARVTDGKSAHQRWPLGIERPAIDQILHCHRIVAATHVERLVEGMGLFDLSG